MQVIPLRKRFVIEFVLLPWECRPGENKQGRAWSVPLEDLKAKQSVCVVSVRCWWWKAEILFPLSRLEMHLHNIENIFIPAV